MIEDIIVEFEDETFLNSHFKVLAITPKKGVDYFTETDKQELIEAIEDDLKPDFVQSENLDNIVPKNTASGESIYIDDALKYKVFNAKIDGNAKQTTTTGKNYFNACAINNAAIAVENDGQTITIDVVASGNGAISTHKTLAELCPNLTAGDQVVLRFNRNLGNTYNNFIYLGVPVAETWKNGTSKTITEEMLGCEVQLYGNRYIDGETEQCIITDFTIMKTNETNTDFEKFTNNEPSPNPDYPQDITVIKDSIKIKQMSKNLFDKTTITESYFLNQDGTTHYSVNYCVSDFIPVTPNTTYFFPRRGTQRTKFYDKNKTVLTNDWDVVDGDVSYTTPEDAYYVRISILTTTNGSIEAVDINKFQFEQGSVATDYEEYKSNEYTINLQNNELVKLADDIKDIIEIDKLGNVSLLKNTTKKIFDGTESWNEFDNQYLMNCVRFRLNYDINDINALCDKLQLKLANEYWINDVECLGYSDTSHYIVVQIKKSRLDENASLQSFKDFLAENNLTVYHKLTEPTTSSITQLTNFKTFEEVNHFFLETNLATNFEIRYAQDLQKENEKLREIIDNQQAEIDEIKSVLSSTATSAMLVENLESDLMEEVEQ